jgi:hypothetical protein
LKVPEGCAICGATWGNHWAEVESQRMFFCCKICETEFRNMIDQVKARTGWGAIDEIKIQGDQRSRLCTAFSGNNAYKFTISFNSQGGIRTFEVSPSQA